MNQKAWFETFHPIIIEIFCILNEIHLDNTENLLNYPI